MVENCQLQCRKICLPNNSKTNNSVTVQYSYNTPTSDSDTTIPTPDTAPPSDAYPSPSSMDDTSSIATDKIGSTAFSVQSEDTQDKTGEHGFAPSVPDSKHAIPVEDEDSNNPCSLTDYEQSLFQDDSEVTFPTTSNTIDHPGQQSLSDRTQASPTLSSINQNLDLRISPAPTPPPSSPGDLSKINAPNSQDTTSSSQHKSRTSSEQSPSPSHSDDDVPRTKRSASPQPGDASTDVIINPGGLGPSSSSENISATQQNVDSGQIPITPLPRSRSLPTTLTDTPPQPQVSIAPSPYIQPHPVIPPTSSTADAQAHTQSTSSPASSDRDSSSSPQPSENAQKSPHRSDTSSPRHSKPSTPARSVTPSPQQLEHPRDTTQYTHRPSARRPAPTFTCKQCTQRYL